MNSKNNNILLCCYQSRESLIKYIEKYKLILDLVIYDEAHFISGWIEKIKNDNNKEEIFLMKNDIFIKNRIFTTATPIDEMILNNQLFGNLIEKVKIYELVNDEILCNIETIIKKLDNKKHEYSDLSILISKSMIDYNKKKGIVYVNNCANAENLYRLIKKQSIIEPSRGNKVSPGATIIEKPMDFSIIEPYIYVSKDIEKELSENKLIKSKKDFIDSEEELTKFENSNNKSIMIAVGKIGYGYDNSWVDFICFGDSRTSDIDIRQIVGRGLRWDKILYPDKILHILIPCYKNEIDNSYEDNKALEAYMNYIIS
jgi:superfamily II DNA or RNA helicase